MSVVIIPAYKPDEALVTITDQLWGYGCRIVVVDDGSDRKYRSIFEKISDLCIILRHSENRGKGAAIKTALAYVKEEFWDENVIGVMDCDGQHLPEGKRTHIFLDEFHVVFKNAYSGAFFNSAWSGLIKYGSSLVLLSINSRRIQDCIN